MIEGVRLKVCGLTTLIDAELADQAGADYLGFILYPGSPRAVSLAQYRGMAARLPERRRVAVCVEPTGDDLDRMLEAGFDFIQVHFRLEGDLARLGGWSERIGPDRLWLAPKLPPAEDVPDDVRRHARHILLDTFHAGGFGGSGRPGDWEKFARHRAAFPEQVWILAGGLAPGNIGEALAVSGARFVDVNSGVEASPGIKDAAKLRELAAALREAAARGR
ncbi:MAG: phosphoribosylanthranilate isomerase [Verrucomicrobia bacterium]|nr:phosphoribosylanthranilate isomerase [Verrucomicrobiota bacterium]